MNQSPLRRKKRRTGFVLVFALVAIMLLTLSVYGLAETMLVEYQAIRLAIQDTQQSYVAESGIETALHALASRDHDDRARAIHPESWTRRNLGMIDGRGASFSIVHLSSESTGESSQIVAGLQNQSGKLNINSLPLELSQAPLARQRLTSIPGIDLRIADAILDWMDEDDVARPLGAESSFYSRLGYRPGQGRLKSIHELVRVRGISQELLFGEDQNGNGWMDACENDGTLSLPDDNADGRLDRGMSAFLTAIGAESNLNAKGQPKLNVNQRDLRQLYDSLVPLVGKEAARFLIAYRLEGPLKQKRAVAVDAESLRQRRLGTAEARLRRHLGIELENQSPSLEYRDNFRAGLDLSRQGTQTIDALTDLFGVRVLVMINTDQEILNSPWDQSAESIRTWLPILEASLTTMSSAERADRINPFAASRESLRTIPGIDEAMVDAILRGRKRIARDPQGHRKLHSVAWLLTDGGLTLEQFDSISPYLTSGGDVFCGFSLGKLEGGKTQSVVKFQINALGAPSLDELRSYRPISIMTDLNQ